MPSLPPARLRPAVNPPARELSLDPRREAEHARALVEAEGVRQALHDELRLAREAAEAAAVAAAAAQAAKPKRSVFDSLRPRTRGGWAIGIATIVTALTAGTAAVVTAVGGGEGLANVFHAPKLKEQIALLRKTNEDLEKKIEALTKEFEADRVRDMERFRFVGAALCKGAMTTARGLDCDAVQWEPRPALKRGEAPPPWRARDYRWPVDPPAKP